MTKYYVRYLFGENKLEDKYFDFAKAYRTVEIDGRDYPVKYDKDAPSNGPFGNPYIDISGQHYSVKCDGKIINKNIFLNEESIDYQAVQQNCWIDYMKRYKLTSISKIKRHIDDTYDGEAIFLEYEIFLDKKDDDSYYINKCNRVLEVCHIPDIRDNTKLVEIDNVYYAIKEDKSDPYIIVGHVEHLINCSGEDNSCYMED